MKINWGTSIVITFVAFITFILYFVVKTFTQKEYDYNLVSEEYYQEELNFQNTINQSINAKDLSQKVIFELANDVLTVKIPNLNEDGIVGEIQFYRPSNDKLDFVKAIYNDEIKIKDNELVKGRWNAVITWHYAKEPKKTYYQKEQFYF